MENTITKRLLGIPYTKIQNVKLTHNVRLDHIKVLNSY